MPRAKIVETSKTIAEFFESTEDTLCVITKEALEVIIQKNEKLDELTEAISPFTHSFSS